MVNIPQAYRSCPYMCGQKGSLLKESGMNRFSMGELQRMLGAHDGWVPRKSQGPSVGTTPNTRPPPSAMVGRQLIT